MKFTHILTLSALAALTAAFPSPSTQDTYTEPPTIYFGTFKVPNCAVNTESHIESHGSIENGKCVYLDWARSIAYNAAFNHTSCDAKFYSDDTCSPDKEVAAPAYNSKELVDKYYPGCWDDVSVLNTWGGVYQDNLVPLINITVTCT